MAEKIQTSFESKCAILADLWINYRDDEDFEAFIAYNDIGLPMAYMIDNGLVEVEDGSIGGNFINETFRLLLAGLEIEEDIGFEVLDDVLETSSVIGPDGIQASDDSDEDFDLEEEEEESDYEADDPETIAWERGWRAGIEAEQDRIQGLCTFYTEMYLEESKGQKAVLWREVADALKPVEVKEYNPEDDGF